MNIRLFLKGNNEKAIISLIDVYSNPFSLNDILNIDLIHLDRKDFHEYDERGKNSLMEHQKMMVDKFSDKRIKLIEEKKSLTINIISESQIDIEYQCELVD